MTWNDRDAESFFAAASKLPDPPDDTPCPRCNMPESRHIGRCGSYTWPRSNARHAGRAEPDDPRRAYPVAASEALPPPVVSEPEDLAGLGVPGLLAALRELRDAGPLTRPERTAERGKALRSLAARQAAESRASHR